jgi:hypothetical protein
MADSGADQLLADALMAAVLPMAFAAADMIPAGGSLAGGAMWWAAGQKRAALSVIITFWVPPQSVVVRAFNMSLGARVTLASSAASFSVLLWDGVGSYATVATGTATEVTARALRCFVAPGTAKALWYLPTADAKEILGKYGHG